MGGIIAKGHLLDEPCAYLLKVVEATIQSIFLKREKPKAAGESLSLHPHIGSDFTRIGGRCRQAKTQVAAVRTPTIVTGAPGRQRAPDSIGIERSLAGMLDFENREVEDLDGVLANVDGRDRAVAHFHLALPTWTAANGRNHKKRPDDISEFAVRRYLEGKSSLEEVVLALYYGNVSVSRVEKTAQVLWGPGADVALITRHACVIEKRITDWLRRPISTCHPYVFLRTMRLIVGKGHRREWGRVLVAVGISLAGIREVLAVRLLGATDASPWGDFIGDLRTRGLDGTELFIGENEPQLIAAVEEHYPGASYQGDFEQMEREVRQATQVIHIPEIWDMLRAVREENSPAAARALLVSVRGALRRWRNTEAERTLAIALPFLHSFSKFPRTHWVRLRENSPFVRVMRDCREWIRVGGPGANSEVILLMMAARWRQASRSWAARQFLSFEV